MYQGEWIAPVRRPLWHVGANAIVSNNNSSKQGQDRSYVATI